MKNRKNVRTFFGVTVILLLMGGCSSLSRLVERGGRALDGSAFAEETLAVFEDKNGGPDHRGLTISHIRRNAGGGEFIALRVNAFPTLQINGGAPAWDGRFSLESLEFLSPNLTGWNEFSRELSGEGLFWANGYYAIFTLRGAPEPLDISGGRIRRDNTRITGDQALAALRNRDERIAAITGWMREWLESREPDHPSFIDQADFEGYWKPILFPETVSAKKRPAAWTVTGAEWARGEDIRWNKTYTAALLPEELWPVRDSGTLLRDWEEAAAWIYYQFAWDYIIESLTSETRLLKIK